MSTLTWNRNSEPDVVSYCVYLNGLQVGSIAQTPVDVRPQWMIPATMSGSLAVAAVDSNKNMSPLSNPVVLNPVDPRIAKLEAQMAGLCRAAKAMGGTATTFAGRVRNEVCG
jgi:hypothetical protein